MRHNNAVWGIAIVKEVAGDVSIVTASGRLGAATAGRWELALGETNKKVVVDLEGVDYVSSAAIRALSSFLDERSIVACGLGDAVRLTFDLAGLLSRLTVAPSRAAALAILNGQADSTPLP